MLCRVLTSGCSFLEAACAVCCAWARISFLIKLKLSLLAAPEQGIKIVLMLLLASGTDSLRSYCSCERVCVCLANYATSCLRRAAGCACAGIGFQIRLGLLAAEM